MNMNKNSFENVDRLGHVQLIEEGTWRIEVGLFSEYSGVGEELIISIGNQKYLYQHIGGITTTGAKTSIHQKVFFFKENYAPAPFTKEEVAKAINGKCVFKILDDSNLFRGWVVIKTVKSPKLAREIIEQSTRNYIEAWEREIDADVLLGKKK